MPKKQKSAKNEKTKKIRSKQKNNFNHTKL